METVVTVNLNGNPYHLDESAYDALRVYLDAAGRALAANPDKAEQVKAKPAMLGWFVGQVMKASGGKANPGKVNELLKRKLAG